jgi:WD40 repeat protein
VIHWRGSDEEDGYEPFEGNFNDFEAKGEIYSVAVNEKTGVIALGDGEDKVYFYDTLKKKLLKTFEEFEDSVISVQYSAEFTYLAAAGMDGKVVIFDGLTNDKIDLLEGDSSDVNVHS